MGRLLEAALAYARRGWPVFPLRPGQKVPACEHGCLDATCDPVQVPGWVELWDDDSCNIGVATGKPSGLWVVDVDGDDGLDALLELGHGVPATLTQYTPSGGLHLLFADPGALRNTASKIAPHVDTRGDGGYIVVAPSVTSKGRYRWGSKQPVEAAPGWLLRLARPVPPKPKPPPKLDDVSAAGYAGAALKAETAELAAAEPGRRNDTLNRAGFKMGTLVGAGLVGRSEVESALRQAALVAGLPDWEVARTLTAAVESGMAHPREVADVV